MIDSILSSDLVWRLGWALLHSLWQILLVGALVGLAVALLSRRSANLRYWVCCCGLASVHVPLVATFAFMPSGPLADVEPARAVSDARVVALDGKPAATVAELSEPAATKQRLVFSADSNAKVITQANRLQSPPPRNLQHSALRLSQIVSPWLPWLVGAWLVVVGLLSIWNFGGWIAVQRLRRIATIPAAARARRRLKRLAKRMRVSQTVRLLESLLVDAPMAIGWLRPVILLPPSLMTNLSAAELDAILAHELAHIRRYDYFVNLLQAFTETVLFYHPVVWWISRRICIEREYCCDDAAIAACGGRSNYVSALAAVERGRAAPQFAMSFLGRSQNMTLNRVRRIMGVSNSSPGAWINGGGAFLLLVALIFVTVFSGSKIIAASGERESQLECDTDLVPVSNPVTMKVEAAKQVIDQVDDAENADQESGKARTKKQQPVNLLRDGGFETPDTGGSPWTTHSAGGLGSWVVEHGTVDIVGSYWSASKGKQSLDLSGMQEMPGTIYQDIETIPMKRYKISFSAAANPEPADIANLKKLKVYWGDLELKSIEFSAKGQDFQNVGWKTYEFVVHAYDEKARLKFESLTNTPCGPVLDNISVTRVDAKKSK